MDPAATLYYDYSPYGFVANNPVKFKDLDGNIITDENGNIVVSSTGKQLTRPMPYPVYNPDGSFTEYQICITYNIVNFYADNGTPIEALQFESVSQYQDIFDKEGNLISTSNSELDLNKFDFSSNCHGLTFANGKLVINKDESVQSILTNDKYSRDVPEDQASALIYSTKEEGAVHSAKRNTNGKYTSKPGVFKTESELSSEVASYGLSKEAEPVKKNSPNRIVKTTFGKTNQGLRIISDENERKQFEESIK